MRRKKKTPNNKHANLKNETPYENRDDDEGEEQIIVITVLRKVNASKDDGMGTMDTTITLPDGTIEETTHTVTVIEEQVYN